MADAVFVGLDGCDPIVVENLSRKGIIDSFWEKKFCAVYQPPNDRGWATIFTGNDASFHGGYYWRPTENHYALSERFNGSMYLVPPIWENLCKNGHSAGIIGVPTTYPAKAIKGFWIAAGGGGTNLSCGEAIYPPLAKPILDKTGYIFDLRFPDYAHRTPIEFVNGLTSVEQLRWECAKRLIDRFGPVSFFGIVFNGMDIIQHFFWDRVLKLYSEGRSYDLLDEAISKYFEKLFKLVRELIAYFESKTCIIASDHGFCGYEKEINITRILAKGNFISKKGIPLKTLGKLAIKEFLPDPIIARLRIIQRSVQMGGVWQLYPPELDWKNSKAVPFKSLSGIYLNRKDRFPMGIIETEEIEEVANSLCEYLGKFTDPQNGNPLFQNIRTANSAYKGPERSLAPDVVFEVPRGYKIEADGLLNQPVIRSHQIRPTSPRFMPGQGHIGIHAPTACAVMFKNGILDDSETILSLESLYTALLNGVNNGQELHQSYS